SRQAFAEAPRSRVPWQRPPSLRAPRFEFRFAGLDTPKRGRGVHEIGLYLRSLDLLRQMKKDLHEDGLSRGNGSRGENGAVDETGLRVRRNGRQKGTAAAATTLRNRIVLFTDAWIALFAQSLFVFANFLPKTFFFLFKLAQNQFL